MEEALALILEDDQCDSADIYIDPPSDGDDTDGDSGPEDIADADHLSGRQLNAQVGFSKNFTPSSSILMLSTYSLSRDEVLLQT